ncbi:sulfotransferase family protein [Cellulomonas sp. PhB143]|nr:sulfotransferase family protein [Cellulomonas sp. PhB143]
MDERDSLRAELDKSRRRLKRARRERDELLAQLGTRAGEAPAGLGYLFIVTYGRSGSTLLQGILNSIPGYAIRGENGDALRGLYEFRERMRFNSNKQRRSTELASSHPYYGIDLYDDPAAREQLQGLALATVIHPPLDARVVGYKEIRWFTPDYQEYLAFVVSVFPGARFVVNTREHEVVAQSKWWAKDPQALEKLGEYEAKLDAMCKVLGDRAFRVHYDEYIADPASLRAMFEWLGEEFDVESVKQVMAVRHSY